MAAGGEQQPQRDQEKTTWQYQPEDSATPISAAALADGEVKASVDSGAMVEWTASEFIAHQKNALWYVMLAALTLVVAAMLYVITRDLFAVIVVIVLGALLGVAGASKPRLMAYRLDRGGLSVGKRFHPYGHFKSFAIVDEGAFASIMLLPLRRFGFPLSVYFPPEDEQKIVDMLSKYLPVQPGSLDTLDRLMRNLHF